MSEHDGISIAGVVAGILIALPMWAGIVALVWAAWHYL